MKCPCLGFDADSMFQLTVQAGVIWYRNAPPREKSTELLCILSNSSIRRMPDVDNFQLRILYIYLQKKKIGCERKIHLHSRLFQHHSKYAFRDHGNPKKPHITLERKGKVVLTETNILFGCQRHQNCEKILPVLTNEVLTDCICNRTSWYFTK